MTTCVLSESEEDSKHISIPDALNMIKDEVAPCLFFCLPCLHTQDAYYQRKACFIKQGTLFTLRGRAAVPASLQAARCIKRVQHVPGLLQQCGVRIFSAHSVCAETSLTPETVCGEGSDIGIPCKCTRRSASCSALPSPA